MKIKYTYYWNEAKDEQGRSLGFFGFQVGHDLSVAYQGEMEMYPGDADEDPARLALTLLYQIFNTDARPRDYRGPSMSVGSVVRLEGGDQDLYYAVANVGFTELSRDDISASKIVPTWWPK